MMCCNAYKLRLASMLPRSTRPLIGGYALFLAAIMAILSLVSVRVAEAGNAMVIMSDPVVIIPLSQGDGTTQPPPGEEPDQPPYTDSREDAVTKSGARRMYTEAAFYPAMNRVVAKTRTWNSVKLSGFHGGVAIVFLDRNGVILGATGVRRFGVDGTLIGRSDRVDIWEEYLDPATNPWLPSVRGIAILHSHASNGIQGLINIINEAVRLGGTIATALGQLNSQKPKD